MNSGGLRIGFTGHQRLTARTEQLIRQALRGALPKRVPFYGICSLAEGSDQIFAETTLTLAGLLIAVIPCEDYARSFSTPQDVKAFQSLLDKSVETIRLGYREPSEEAYWAAGRRVVDEANRVLAVWDGKEAGGLGGTADVVQYARAQGKEVEVVWPTGAARKAADRKE